MCAHGRCWYELHYTVCSFLSSKSRCQDRGVRDLLVKYLWRIKGREQGKMKRAFISKIGVWIWWRWRQGMRDFRESHILQPNSKEVFRWPLENGMSLNSTFTCSLISCEQPKGNIFRVKGWWIQRGSRRSKQVCWCCCSCTKRVHWSSLGTAGRLSFKLQAHVLGRQSVPCISGPVDYLGFFFWWQPRGTRQLSPQASTFQAFTWMRHMY